MLVFQLTVTLPEPAVMMPSVNQLTFSVSAAPATNLFANQNASMSIAELYCEHGFTQDEKGCEICKCMEKCPVGEEWDELTMACVPVSCESPRACSDDT